MPLFLQCLANMLGHKRVVSEQEGRDFMEPPEGAERSIVPSTVIRKTLSTFKWMQYASDGGCWRHGYLGLGIRSGPLGRGVLPNRSAIAGTPARNGRRCGDGDVESCGERPGGHSRCQPGTDDAIHCGRAAAKDRECPRGLALVAKSGFRRRDEKRSTRTQVALGPYQ